MPTDFDPYPNDKAGTGQRPPRRTVIPFDSGRRGMNGWAPIDAVKAESAVSWPGFWARRWSRAGLIFVIGIALFCTLYAGLRSKKSNATTQPNQQLRSDANSQSPSAVRSPAKPSPVPPAVTAQSETSVPSQTATAAPRPRSFLPGPYHGIKYEATHKKAFGGCTGQLELTSARLHFRCSHEPDLDIPVSSIASAHRDGVVLTSGDKYHFVIANHTKVQAETIFNLWLNRARQFERASR